MSVAVLLLSAVLVVGMAGLIVVGLLWED